MEPIFDREGITVAWRKRDELFDCAGRHCGYIRDRAVFALDGTHRGWFLDGFYRDRDGRCLGFEEGATGGPLLPPGRELAIAPQPEPARPLERTITPAPLVMKPRTWSEAGWHAWLGEATRV